MRFVTRDTDYALRALIFMANALAQKKKKVVSVEDIVRSEKLPRVFLRRILQRLAEKKILLSYKGKAGGFSFLARPLDISLADIIRIFQGDIDLTNCILKGRPCPKRGLCGLRKKMKAVNSIVIKELEKITISSLAG